LSIALASGQILVSPSNKLFKLGTFPALKLELLPLVLMLVQSCSVINTRQVSGSVANPMLSVGIQLLFMLCIAGFQQQ
jgi:hypothetical protein